MRSVENALFIFPANRSELKTNYFASPKGFLYEADSL